jgi:hypothetical protein
MGASQHLQVVSLSYCRGEDVLFGPFPLLTKEAPLRIWHALY